jgi:hemerythrin
MSPESALATAVNKPNLVWSSDFAVGVTQMDEQHIALFALFNDVCAGIEENRPPEELEPILAEFFNRTRLHFASEEALLRAAEYPSLDGHLEHHRDLDILLKEYMRRFQQGELGDFGNLLSFLRQWLVRHIKNEDTEYGAWLNSRGIR